jgi:hypothetical protein
MWGNVDNVVNVGKCGQWGKCGQCGWGSVVWLRDLSNH